MFTFGPRVDIDCPLRSDAQRSDVLENGRRAWGKTHEAARIYYCNGSVAISCTEPQESRAALDNFVSRKKNWNCA